jgi:hypothetical protein
MQERIVVQGCVYRGCPNNVEWLAQGYARNPYGIGQVVDVPVCSDHLEWFGVTGKYDPLQGAWIAGRSIGPPSTIEIQHSYPAVKVRVLRVEVES